MGDFLKALSLIKELVDAIKSIMAFIQANQNEAWFQLSRGVAERLKAAQTDDERRAIAKDILSLWAGIPK